MSDMLCSLSSVDPVETALYIVFRHVVGGAAFIADPPALVVHPDRVELAQDAAALAADPDDRPEAVAAEKIPGPVFGMHPVLEFFGLLAEITRFHNSPFFVENLLYYNMRSGIAALPG
jgi:hypothetical protein